jgi:hypothetical protein
MLKFGDFPTGVLEKLGFFGAIAKFFEKFFISSPPYSIPDKYIARRHNFSVGASKVFSCPPASLVKVFPAKTFPALSRYIGIGC